jgi:hypothetical protein
MFHSAGTLKKGLRRAFSTRLYLSRAYRMLFHAKADKQQADMVLVDLLNFSGYYKVAPAGSDAIALARHEGRREVAGRIMQNLRMTDAEIDAMERTVRQEALVDQVEGELL